MKATKKLPVKPFSVWRLHWNVREWREGLKNTRYGGVVSKPERRKEQKVYMKDIHVSTVLLSNVYALLVVDI